MICEMKASLSGKTEQVETTETGANQPNQTTLEGKKIAHLFRMTRNGTMYHVQNLFLTSANIVSQKKVDFQASPSLCIAERSDWWIMEKLYWAKQRETQWYNDDDNSNSNVNNNNINNNSNNNNWKTEEIVIFLLSHYTLGSFISQLATHFFWPSFSTRRHTLGTLYGYP